MPITDFQAGSSPLASRANPLIYVAIIVALLVIGLSILIWFGIKFLQNYKNSNQYLENAAKKITSSTDVNNFCSKYKIPKNEKTILLKICKKIRIPNIFYLIKEKDGLLNFLNKFYSEKKAELSTDDLFSFFNLRFRLEKIFSNFTIYKSSRQIPLKTEISTVIKNSGKFKFILCENNKDFMILDPEPNFISNTKKPEPMEKLLFSFSSETSLQYGFFSRIIRYERTEQGSLRVIISHPSILYKQAKRNFKRAKTNETILFKSAKPKTPKGFSIGEKSFYGKITNISAGGVCLYTDLPIKANQFVELNLSPFGLSENIIGKIVSTRNTMKKGFYNLHIHFIQISKEDRVKIQKLSFDIED